MNRNKWIRALMILLTLSGLASLAAAQDVVHVVSGVVTKVDSGTKTMAVKTSDGTEHVFKYTENTAVRGAHEGSEAAKAGLMDTLLQRQRGLAGRRTLHESRRRRCSTPSNGSR